MVKRIRSLLFIPVFSFICVQLTSAQINAPFFKDAWGSRFQLKTTESGEFLTVTAIASDGSFLFLYDLADRTLVKIDSSGTFILKSKLESIGRSTYLGDDFIIRGTEAIFLNAVDYRLEYFDYMSGKHKKSTAFSRELLPESRRSRKIVNRIFLDGNSILLGNSHTLVVLSENALAKQQQVLQTLQFPDDTQVIFYNRTNPIHKKSGLFYWSDHRLPNRKSTYSFSGKNMVLLNGTPVHCIASKNGIEIYREQ